MVSGLSFYFNTDLHQHLALQSAELTRKNDHILDEKLSAAKSEYLTSLSGLSGTVTGLTEALTSRASADKASLRAQVLSVLEIHERMFLCVRASGWLALGW